MLTKCLDAIFPVKIIKKKMESEKRNLRNLLSEANREKRFMILCVLIGLIAGTLSIAFHLSIIHLFNFAWKIGGIFGEEYRHITMPLIPTLAGLITGICIKLFAPQAKGGGIPQTKATFFNKFGIFKPIDVVYRFLISAFYIGFGNSAGKEGPTVHMCAATSSVLAQKMKFAKDGVQSAVPIGVAAGISASFNSPLSAISFVFEEFFGGFGNAKTRSMGGLILAVVIAAVLSRLLLGENPSIPLANAEFETGWYMLVCFPIAIISGVVGHFFITHTILIKKFAQNFQKIPLAIWLALGGLATGVSGMFAYDISGYDSVFSIGYGVLIPAFEGKVALLGLFVIFVFKLLTTILNYALGGSGGIFSGALVIGGTLGATFGAIMCALFGLDSSIIGACLMMGVGACIASIVRCPITSILMIFELTLNYSLILPILAGNVVAYFISKKLSPLNVYDSVLLADKITLKKLSSFKGQRDWAQIPVGAIASFDVETLNSEHLVKEELARLENSQISYSAYPVLNEIGELQGTARLEDLKKPQFAEKKVSEILFTDSEIFVEPTLSISQTANVFVSQDALMLPIIKRTNPKKLIGIITLHDIARQQNASEKELF